MPKYALMNNYMCMRVLLLSLFLLLGRTAFTQEERSVQIIVTPVSDSTRIEFDDIEYFTNKENMITVNACPGLHDLYIFLPTGLIVYTLDISNKTSIIVIEL